MTEADPGVTVVTGAAGGIGSAIVRAALDRGGAVVGVDLAAGPAAGADRLRWVRGDIAAAETIDAAFAAAGELGGARALVCAPFAEHRAPLVEQTADRLTAVFEAQVGTAWRWATRLVADRTTGAGDTAIVHVSSVHARLAAPGSGPYALAKAALAALTRAMAVEWGPRGVRCNAVEPGYVPVPRNAHRRRGPDGDAAIAAHLPLRRVVTPAEVAAAVVFLAGPTASGITGTCLPVDAGMTAAMPEWA